MIDELTLEAVLACQKKMQEADMPDVGEVWIMPYQLKRLCEELDVPYDKNRTEFIWEGWTMKVQG